MKASRHDKMETQVAVTEASLLEVLSTALPHTAEHGDLLFFNSAFRPDYIQPHQLGERAELLLSLATESVALREQIGMPVIGSVGELYLSACSEAANVTNANRRGPRQLAAWLLGELGSNHSFKVTPDGAPQLDR